MKKLEKIDAEQEVAVRAAAGLLEGAGYLRAAADMRALLPDPPEKLADVVREFLSMGETDSDPAMRVDTLPIALRGAGYAATADALEDLIPRLRAALEAEEQGS